MKVVLAILAVAATAQAAPYSFYRGAAIPIDGGYPYTDALGFSTYAHGAVSPLTYSNIPAYSRLTYSANAAPHSFYSGAAIPIDGGYPYTNSLGFSTYAHGAVSPITYNRIPAYSPLTYSNFQAVVPQTYAVAPAPGYVAQTLGATHIAPLPAGIGYSSHHINLAPAPGTE